jgi:DNA polymerase-3 subunit delta
MKKVSCYLLLGPDAVSKREDLGKILALHGIEQSPENPQLVGFHLAEESPAAVFDEALTPAFFGDGKAIVVHGAERLPDKELGRYLKDSPAGTILILLSELPPKKFPASIQKLVEPVGEVLVHWEPFEDKVDAWVVRQARVWKLEAPPGLGPLLAGLCGTSTLLVERCLQLLSARFGDARFSIGDATALLADEGQVGDGFALANRVFSGQARDAVLLFRRLANEGETPLGLLALLTRQLELLWRYLHGVRDERALGLFRSAHQQLTRQAPLWSSASLARAFAACAELDFRLKSDPEPLRLAGFERMLIQLARMCRRPPVIR